MQKQWMLAAAALVALAPGGARAASVQARFGVPSSVEFSALADQCTNNPGPFITFSGDLTVGGIGGRLIFRNNVQGTHEHVEETSTGVTLLPAGSTIHFAKQPPQGGVGGNPYIWVQFYDGAWK